MIQSSESNNLEAKTTKKYLFGSAGKGSDQKYSWSSAAEAVIRSLGSNIKSLSSKSQVSLPRLLVVQLQQKEVTTRKLTTHKHP